MENFSVSNAAKSSKSEFKEVQNKRQNKIIVSIICTFFYYFVMTIQDIFKI